MSRARIPLMKAAELDQSNPKIISNLVLYLLASGRTHDAQKLMAQQKLSADVRNDIRNDATRITAAARTWRRASQASASASVSTPIGSGSVVDVSGRMSRSVRPRWRTSRDSIRLRRCCSGLHNEKGIGRTDMTNNKNPGRVARVCQGVALLVLMGRYRGV